MKVETVPVSSLVLDPANVRKHSAKNLEAIKGSLARFGQQKPIVVTEAGVVIAGNGTLIAARELGWPEVNVVRTALTGTDLTAYGIADNRTGELAEWDSSALAESLASLRLADFELESIGFDEIDVDRLLGTGTEVKPEEAWEGMPEFEQGDKTSARQIIVHFATLEDVRAFSDLVGQTITDKTRSIWYPRAEIETYADKRYASEP